MSGKTWKFLRSYFLQPIFMDLFPQSAIRLTILNGFKSFSSGATSHYYDFQVHFEQNSHSFNLLFLLKIIEKMVGLQWQIFWGTQICKGFWGTQILFASPYSLYIFELYTDLFQIFLHQLLFSLLFSMRWVTESNIIY